MYLHFCGKFTLALYNDCFMPSPTPFHSWPFSFFCFSLSKTDIKSLLPGLPIIESALYLLLLRGRVPLIKESHPYTWIRFLPPASPLSVGFFPPCIFTSFSTTRSPSLALRHSPEQGWLTDLPTPWAPSQFSLPPCQPGWLCGRGVMCGEEEPDCWETDAPNSHTENAPHLLSPAQRSQPHTVTDHQKCE